MGEGCEGGRCEGERVWWGRGVNEDGERWRRGRDTATDTAARHLVVGAVFEGVGRGAHRLLAHLALVPITHREGGSEAGEG